MKLNAFYDCLKKPKSEKYNIQDNDDEIQLNSFHYFINYDDYIKKSDTDFDLYGKVIDIKG